MVPANNETSDEKLDRQARALLVVLLGSLVRFVDAATEYLREAADSDEDDQTPAVVN